MGIDLGDARTGISISDLSGTLAGQPQVITEYNVEKLIEKIVSLVAQHHIEEIVLGNPKNMKDVYKRQPLCGCI